MIIPLDRTRKTPLYRQIVHHLRMLIESGALSPGAKLPATRELATTLDINRNTVNTAYEELLAHGLIVAHVGQGTFVAPLQPEEAVPKRPQPSFPHTTMRMDWLSLFSKGSMSAEDAYSPAPRTVACGDGIISFAAGALETALFPVDEFRRSIDRALREYGETLLGYGSVEGFPGLKTFLRSYLLDRGIDTHEDDILITNGSQQGLDLVARSFLDPGDLVVTESPTYAGVISVFRALRANILTIPPLAYGFQPEHLENLLRRQRPKMLYLVPTFHNPTGLTADLESRKRLLETIAGYNNIVVVEDDTHERLRYEGQAVPSLKSISRSRQIVYISTFSTVFPGLRLGWAVADRPVTARLAAMKRITDMHTSDLIQAAVYDFGRRRWMERSIERVNTERRRRRDAMLAALEKYMPDGVRWTRPEGGLWLMLTLPEPLDSSRLLNDAAAAGVMYIPGSLFHPNGGGEQELRLVFPQIPLPTIEEGIRRLAGVVTDALQGRTAARSARRAAIDPMV